MPLQLQFRFQPMRRIDDVDPSRIEPLIAALPNVERFRVFDDRLSDADFVTVVVVLRDAGPTHLAALKTALARVTNVQVSTVDRSGNTRVLDTVPPEQLPAVAASDVQGL